MQYTSDVKLLYLGQVDSAISVRVFGVYFFPNSLPCWLQSLTPWTPGRVEIANDCSNSRSQLKLVSNAFDDEFRYVEGHLGWTSPLHIDSRYGTVTVEQ